MAYTVLIEESDGTQAPRIFDDTTKYSGPVVWDERVHGKLPTIDPTKLGGYQKVGATLVFSPSKFSAFQAAKQADVDDEAQRKLDRVNGATEMKAAKSFPEFQTATLKYLGIK